MTHLLRVNLSEITMNFDKFKATYNPPLSRTEISDDSKLEILKSPGARDFLSAFSGITIGDGLYRVHHFSEIEPWTQRVTGCLFKKYASRVECFGCDWRGRQFAVESQRRNADGIPLVTMFDPETGKAFNTSFTFSGFHNDALINLTDAVLDLELFQNWRKANQNISLKHKDCIGCRIPLCLGGRDDVSNYEVTDMSVYWELTGQFLEGTKNVPAGTKISGVNVSKQK